MIIRLCREVPRGSGDFPSILNAQLNRSQPNLIHWDIDWNWRVGKGTKKVWQQLLVVVFVLSLSHTCHSQCLIKLCKKQQQQQQHEAYETRRTRSRRRWSRRRAPAELCRRMAHPTFITGSRLVNDLVYCNVASQFSPIAIRRGNAMLLSRISSPFSIHQIEGSLLQAFRCRRKCI